MRSMAGFHLLQEGSPVPELPSAPAQSRLRFTLERQRWHDRNSTLIEKLFFFLVNTTELPVEAGNNGEVIEPGAGKQRKCFALRVTAIKALSHYFEAVKV